MSTVHTPTGTIIEPGVWDVDASHSEVGFTARHLMVSKVRGRFTDVTATIRIADDPLQSSVEAEIATASISTGDDTRDEHLRGADFFDVERYPTIRFRSTGVRHVKGSDYVLDGELTIREVTRPVELSLEYLGEATDPWGGTRSAFAAETEVSRKAWGLEWNVALETGGVLVGDKVKLHLDIEAVRR